MILRLPDKFDDMSTGMCPRLQDGKHARALPPCAKNSSKDQAAYGEGWFLTRRKLLLRLTIMGWGHLGCVQELDTLEPTNRRGAANLMLSVGCQVVNCRTKWAASWPHGDLKTRCTHPTLAKGIRECAIKGSARHWMRRDLLKVGCSGDKNRLRW